MSARVLCLVVLALALPTADAADLTLGRLFFTPAERHALEEARRKNIRAEVQADQKPKRRPVREVSVTGVVRRSDGESTVWVNGKPVDDGATDGLRVRVTAGSQAAVIVYAPDRNRTVRLKVGQSADILSGRVEEAYERRAAPAPQATLPEPAPLSAEPPPVRRPKDPADGPDATAEDDSATPGEPREDAEH